MKEFFPRQSVIFYYFVNSLKFVIGKHWAISQKIFTEKFRSFCSYYHILTDYIFLIKMTGDSVQTPSHEI